MNYQELEQRYLESHQDIRNIICHGIGIPFILISIILFISRYSLKVSFALFGIGWFFQFLGHLFEGKRPSFLESPIYFFIGPIYFLRKIFLK